MTVGQQSARDDAGFTLLELLVTLGIMSFIATLLLGGVVTLRQSAQRFLAGDSANATVDAAQAILRARIEGLRAIPRSDRATPVVDFEGNGERLSFYAPPIGRDAPGSLQALRLVRMSTGDLMLFSASSLTENVDLRSPSIVGWTPTRLIDGAAGLSLAYFGPAPGVAGGAWQRVWTNRAQPPQLVRIAVNFAEGDRRRWLDLIVRPRVSVNLACRIDLATARCDDATAR